MRPFVIWSIFSILGRHSFITSLSKPENLCIIIIIKHILLSLIRHNWAGNNMEAIKPSDVYSAQGNRFFLRFPESFVRTGVRHILALQQILPFIPLCLTFTRAFSSPWSEPSSCDREGRQLQAVAYFKGTSRRQQKPHSAWGVRKMCPCVRPFLFTSYLICQAGVEVHAWANLHKLMHSASCLNLAG